MADSRIQRCIASDQIRQSRRGFVSLKLILLIPVLLTLLVVILEVGNLWLARLELENSLESAALSAVKEWGDANGASGTFDARCVADEFAGSNTVRGMAVSLSSIDPQLNWDPNNLPNENRECPGGVLIFGAITGCDPDVVFDDSVAPSCGGDGALLFDVTEQGNTGLDHAWGVSFRTDPNPLTNQFLRVDRIVIDVDPTGTNQARFNFSSFPPVLSDNLSQPIIRDSIGPNSQPDNFGFTQAPNAPTNQVFFSPTTGTPSQLTITFAADGSDTGFNPGDRFRFGALVERRRGNNFQQADGDDIGQIPAQVTVYFSFAGNPTPTPSTGVFFDNSTSGLDRRNDCSDPGTPFFDDLNNFHLIQHGREIVDLPCPAASAANNNGQSFLLLDGGGLTRSFAVHAQAEKEVPTVIEQLFGCRLGPFRVQAEATAYYDCQTRRPCLIRVDRFLCNGVPVDPSGGGDNDDSDDDDSDDDDSDDDDSDDDDSDDDDSDDDDSDDDD